MFGKKHKVKPAIHDITDVAVPFSVPQHLVVTLSQVYGLRPDVEICCHAEDVALGLVAFGLVNGDIILIGHPTVRYRIHTDATASPVVCLQFVRRRACIAALHADRKIRLYSFFDYPPKCVCSIDVPADRANGAEPSMIFYPEDALCLFVGYRNSIIGVVNLPEQYLSLYQMEVLPQLNLPLVSGDSDATDIKYFAISNIDANLAYAQVGCFGVVSVNLIQKKVTQFYKLPGTMCISTAVFTGSATKKARAALIALVLLITNSAGDQRQMLRILSDKGSGQPWEPLLDVSDMSLISPLDAHVVDVAWADEATLLVKNASRHVYQTKLNLEAKLKTVTSCQMISPNSFWRGFSSLAAVPPFSIPDVVSASCCAGTEGENSGCVFTYSLQWMYDIRLKERLGNRFSRWPVDGGARTYGGEVLRGFDTPSGLTLVTLLHFVVYDNGDIYAYVDGMSLDSTSFSNKGMPTPSIRAQYQEDLSLVRFLCGEDIVASFSLHSYQFVKVESAAVAGTEDASSQFLSLLAASLPKKRFTNCFLFPFSATSVGAICTNAVGKCTIFRWDGFPSLPAQPFACGKVKLDAQPVEGVEFLNSNGQGISSSVYCRPFAVLQQNTGSTLNVDLDNGVVRFQRGLEVWICSSSAEYPVSVFVNNCLASPLVVTPGASIPAEVSVLTVRFFSCGDCTQPLTSTMEHWIEDTSRKWLFAAESRDLVSFCVKSFLLVTPEASLSIVLSTVAQAGTVATFPFCFNYCPTPATFAVLRQKSNLSCVNITPAMDVVQSVGKKSVKKHTCAPLWCWMPESGREIRDIWMAHVLCKTEVHAEASVAEVLLASDSCNALYLFSPFYPSMVERWELKDFLGSGETLHHTSFCSGRFGMSVQFVSKPADKSLSSHFRWIWLTVRQSWRMPKDTADFSLELDDDVSRFSWPTLLDSYASPQLFDESKLGVFDEKQQPSKVSILKSFALKSIGANGGPSVRELYGTDSTVFSSLNQRAPRADTSVNGAAAAAANALEALGKRGEKLNQLSDMSNNMEAAAEDFYRMMKEYNEEQAKKKWWQI